MTFENFEAAVLLLLKQSQVALLARMLERPWKNNEVDPEASSIWVEEAELRDSFACAKGNRAMDNDETTGILAEKVFQRVRAFLLG